jgi:threonine synthase
MSETGSRLVCAGCGRATDSPLPFRCAAFDLQDDIDHVVAQAGPPSGAKWPTVSDSNPFLRFRSLLYSWHVAREWGLTDTDYVRIVRTLDSAIANIDGQGFSTTPYTGVPELAAELGLANGGVWVKDETGNVSGSHKARHLMGVAIYLAVAEESGVLSPEEATRPLAIASCGNAALAAAVIAGASNRRLRVFVPTWAEPTVVSRLQSLGADLETCGREPTAPPGDPCYSRFQRQVANGALPFSCQGPDNGLSIEGGMTLGWELVAQHAQAGAPPLDRLIIQVGGGALASSCIQSLRWAHALGALDRLPAIHAVQTVASHPLVRGWRRFVDGAGGRLCTAGFTPPDSDSDSAMAGWLQRNYDRPEIAAETRHAKRHRSRYMWPVEEPPTSVASSILDDETYDWMEVVRGMVDTGGWPLVADEETLIHANHRGQDATGIPVDATGTAGLAGAFLLHANGELRDDEQVAVLFTGVQR